MRWILGVTACVLLFGLGGCTTEVKRPVITSTAKSKSSVAESKSAAAEPNQLPSPAPTQAADSASPQDPQADTKRVAVGKNVWFEVTGKNRRVVVDGYICLREGYLEEFMCKKYTKEHESIVAADIDARDLHKALVLIGAEPGAPAQFDPTYKPARGDRIKVTVQYQKDGKTVTIPAQNWLRNVESKKQMAVDWVFAGSKLSSNLLDPAKPPYYVANDGDVISVSNFDGSLLDIPVRSSAENANLTYEAFTERIPPLETKVQVIFERMTAEG